VGLVCFPYKYRNKVLAHRERKEREREWFSEGLGNCLVNIQLYSYGNCIAIYTVCSFKRKRERLEEKAKKMQV
jgi:hypothetical protein